MNDNTHPLAGTQRLVRSIRQTAASVAKSQIDSSMQLATVITIAPSNATLATALVSGTAYTSLSVTALKVAIASGDSVILQTTSASNTQTFVASAAVAVGATTISVTSLAANYAYPIGAYVDPSTLTVKVDGTSTAIYAHRLNSYTPAINDRVICQLFAKQVLVLGTFT